MSIFSVTQLALPGIATLISTLAYGSQILFRSIEPSPLAINEASTFNILVCCIWVCYYQACFTNPGSVPVGWEPQAFQNDDSTHSIVGTQSKQRWCRKCNAAKPPRAHHCKSCGRCIPKMDHHCPWTANCVSYRTFPHFFRFLFYAVISMCQLEYFLYIRISYLWDRRYLPSYLGPSPTQLVCLFIFIILNSVTLFALLVLLIRNIWVLGANVTTIEGWEIERHATLVRRAKVWGGYLDGPDGSKIRVVKHEFPYDIGIFTNIQQALGHNPLIWLWPFAATLDNKSHLRFPTNGFEDAGSSWPPPDPDRMPRRIRSLDSQHAFTYRENVTSNQDRVQAFKQRQQEDYKRINEGGSMFARRTPFSERFDGQGSETTEWGQDIPSDSRKNKGEEAWENSEGERLKDFGVDEDIEFYDEEDEVPLSQLLVRRRQGIGRHEDHRVVND